MVSIVKRNITSLQYYTLRNLFNMSSSTCLTVFYVKTSRKKVIFLLIFCTIISCLTYKFLILSRHQFQSVQFNRSRVLCTVRKSFYLTFIVYRLEKNKKTFHNKIPFIHRIRVFLSEYSRKMWQISHCLKRYDNKRDDMIFCYKKL